MRRRGGGALAGDLIPLWAKIVYTIFLCVLVPAYWVHWGPRNFLWFSDIALLTTGAALWLESALLASMMTVAIALPELVWNVDFFGRLVTGRHPFGLSEYMFDAKPVSRNAEHVLQSPSNVASMTAADTPRTSRAGAQ